MGSSPLIRLIRRTAPFGRSGRSGPVRALFLGCFLVPVLFHLPPSFAALEGHGGFVKSVAIAPDGRLGISASFDYRLILWDLDAQAPLRDFQRERSASS